jgi:hypothetical protein
LKFNNAPKYLRLLLNVFVVLMVLSTISYSQDGSNTVLVANFVNGNTDFFKSRVYLWNPSVNAGNVSVRVFTLEQTGSSTLLGMVDLGSLGPRSALNIKLEDILDELMISRPYETNNGNLTLEFTIGAEGVLGAAQVFNNSLTLAFGTYPLQAVPSISAGSPTVLVANFLNGNTDFFRSRIYLFNPSASDGNVTVRVFTLPRTDGQTDELTTLPHPLGALAARSALNIRLEDILDDLLPPGPYEIDAGNLTLDFTIQASDVVGAAQVFDNSLTLAFGTYPLQETIVRVQECQDTVSLADPNLETAVREALGLNQETAITCEQALSLKELTARNPFWNIRDLSGLEVFANLTSLDLGFFNDIGDITPIAGLTQLTFLNLGFNSISDIIPVTGLTQLTDLNLGFNSISDITPVTGLTQLTDLNVFGNSISDITPVAGLTQLTDLALGGHPSLSDITPVTGLTQLTDLNLQSSSISDITPVAGLTQLHTLSLRSNLINDLSPLITNPGLGAGDSVDLRSNSLDAGDCADVQTLIDRGADISHDVFCP